MTSTTTGALTTGDLQNQRAVEAERANGVCPSCGYCPHCGRRDVKPYQPYQPYWVYPWYNSNSGTTISLNGGLTSR